MTRSVRTISGRTAVITGAASGIGRSLAQRLSAHSCPVAIADEVADWTPTRLGAVFNNAGVAVGSSELDANLPVSCARGFSRRPLRRRGSAVHRARSG
jgi:hypothetical protein